MELVEGSAEAQQRSRRAMTRHDTEKYEADSRALLLEGLQYSAKKHGRLQNRRFCSPSPLSLATLLRLAGLMVVTTVTISFNLAVLPGKN
jgi:hypothetical protein